MITTGQKNESSTRWFLFLRLIIGSIPPPFFSRRTCPDLHSGVCYFIEFDARYLTSPSVRFPDDLIWSAASFLGTSVLHFCI